MISSLRQREIELCALGCIEDAGITSLPVDPKIIATKARIAVMPWNPTKLGVSGFLMRKNQEFGIGYSTAIGNRGFENFTVGHELGHYFLDGHPEAVFADGDTHYSESGFVSDNKHEREADAFAAELLMPGKFFRDALNQSGSGFAAIQKLADLGNTSLVATGIRFVKTTPDPVAVILSSGDRMDWCFLSNELRKCRGVFNLGKGTVLPRESATARFNGDGGNIQRTENIETHCSLRQWFDDAPDVEFQEDVVGLGHYGKTLTVLFTEDALSDEDESEEEEGDSASDLPSSRWRSQDRDRRL